MWQCSWRGWTLSCWCCKGLRREWNWNLNERVETFWDWGQRTESLMKKKKMILLIYSQNFSYCVFYMPGFPTLTWHLIGWVCSLTRLRCGEAGAVAEARLQRRRTLGQTALCLNAWQHHTEVWNKRQTWNTAFTLSIFPWKTGNDQTKRFLGTLHRGLSPVTEELIYYTTTAPTLTHVCNSVLLALLNWQYWFPQIQRDVFKYDMFSWLCYFWNIIQIILIISFTLCSGYWYRGYLYMFVKSDIRATAVCICSYRRWTVHRPVLSGSKPCRQKTAACC